MGEPDIGEAAHGQADEGDETEGPQYQEGEDVKVQVPFKEFRLDAGECEKRCRRYAGTQHFGDIGPAAHAAYGVKVGFEDFMAHSFGLFRCRLFDSFVVGKHFGFLAVHEGDGDHLFSFVRLGNEDRGDGVGEDGQALGVFSFPFGFGNLPDEVLSFIRREFHVNGGGFLIPDAHADDGYFHTVKWEFSLSFGEGVEFNMFVFIHLFPGGGVFLGKASKAVAQADFTGSSGFPVLSAAGGFSCVFCNIGDVKIHIHCFSLLFTGPARQTVFFIVT